MCTVTMQAALITTYTQTHPPLYQNSELNRDREVSSIHTSDASLSLSPSFPLPSFLLPLSLPLSALRSPSSQQVTFNPSIPHYPHHHMHHHYYSSYGPNISTRPQVSRLATPAVVISILAGTHLKISLSDFL